MHRIPLGMKYCVVMIRYFVPLIVVLSAAFAAPTAKPADSAVVPMSKDSEVPRKTTSRSTLRDRSKSVVSERAPMPVRKTSSYLFWTVRLPWSPNAPGD